VTTLLSCETLPALSFLFIYSHSYGLDLTTKEIKIYNGRYAGHGLLFYLAPKQPEDKRKQQGDENTGGNRKIEAEPFLLDVNIAGQLPQPGDTWHKGYNQPDPYKYQPHDYQRPSQATQCTFSITLTPAGIALDFRRLGCSRFDIGV